MTESRELRAAWLTVFLLAVGYVLYMRFRSPSPSDPIGHALGIVGTLLMIATETLYTIRKRTNWIQRGQLRHWLSAHIFMGIVGPTMVLMHTAWKFEGLAGLTMLLTVVVVASGFFGRYIYTSVPRTMSGVAVEHQQLSTQIDQLNRELQTWLAAQPAQVREIVQRQALRRQQAAAAVGGSGSGAVMMVLSRVWDDWTYRRELRRTFKQIQAVERSKAREIDRLLQRRHTLERQAASLASARRLMGQWRAAHVPLGTALFTAVTLHVIAALVFSTFAR